MRIHTGLVVAAIPFLMAARAVPARAQSQVGIIVGLNLSNFVFSPPVSQAFEDRFLFDIVKSKGFKGIAAGIAVLRPVSERAALQVEGLFSHVGTSFTGEFEELLLASTAGARPAGAPVTSYLYEQSIRLKTLEVGGLANITLGSEGRAAILAGMYMSFTLSQSETVSETVNGERHSQDLTGDSQFVLKDRHVGLAVGAEVLVGEKIKVGGRLKMGLTNIDPAADGPDPLFNSIKVRTFLVYLMLMK